MIYVTKLCFSYEIIYKYVILLVYFNQISVNIYNQNYIKGVKMGLLSFAINAGKKLLGMGNDNEAVKKEIEENNATMPIENLEVKVEGDTVTISGNGDDVAKEKAALIAGNIKGIKNVNFEGVKGEDEATYYEIQSGDSLSKIAKQFYGDGNQYMKIFEANKEVIKDPNLIYPGQKIRIPK